MMARHPGPATIWGSPSWVPALRSSGWWLAIAVLAVVMLRPAPSVAGDPSSEFDPATGYRISRYQAPVPDTVPGGRRVAYEEVLELQASGHAILVDVMTADGALPDPETGQWQLAKPRRNIPGSHWLPGVGRGRIGPALDRYFAAELARLTANDKSKPVLIYCLADCWMGWNAVQRAAGYGYTNILWYPEGTDGWRDWNGVLTDGEPIPMAPADAADYRASTNAGKAHQ